MGKTDIEDALLRLENAILEETRMAAAESLKGIHALQGIVEDRMKGVEGMLEGVGDMLQGFDERVVYVGQRGINGAQITFNWLPSPFRISLWSDDENAANQTANDVGTAPLIGLATVPGADESIKTKADDGIIEDLGARLMDGAHVILNRYLTILSAYTL